jgi:hypothetical protein
MRIAYLLFLMHVFCLGTTGPMAGSGADPLLSPSSLEERLYTTALEGLYAQVVEVKELAGPMQMLGFSKGAESRFYNKFKAAKFYKKEGGADEEVLTLCISPNSICDQVFKEANESLTVYDPLPIGSQTNSASEAVVRAILGTISADSGYEFEYGKLRFTSSTGVPDCSLELIRPACPEATLNGFMEKNKVVSAKDATALLFELFLVQSPELKSDFEAYWKANPGC